MSGTRPTIRHGLPYGWWKRREFWVSALSFIMLLGFMVLGLALLYGWFANVQPSEVGLR